MENKKLTIYEEYALLQKEADVIDARKELLREKISHELPEDGFKSDIINAYWTTKKKWVYSPKVDGINAELKSQKEKEEKDGTAKAEEVKQLTIKVAK